MKKLKTLLIILCLSVALVGCSNYNPMYNASIRDAKIKETTKEGSYKNPHYYVICDVNGKEVKYELSNDELFNGINDLIEANKVLKPNDDVVLDMIYDSQNQLIIAAGMAPGKEDK